MPPFAVFFSDGAGFGIEMVQAADAQDLLEALDSKFLVMGIDPLERSDRYPMPKYRW